MRKIKNTALLVLFLLLPLQAWAHKLKVFASVADGRIEGYVYSSGGERPSGLPVEIIFADDSGSAGKLNCNEKGEFSFIPQFCADYKVCVDSGDGHKAEYLLKSELLPDSLPPREGKGTATNAAAPSPSLQPEQRIKSTENDLSRQIKALREQLEEHDSKVRIRDILGGIGYIFGLCGLGAYFLALRERKK